MPKRQRTDTHCSQGHSFAEHGYKIDAKGRWRCNQCSHLYGVSRYKEIKDNLSLSDLQLKHLKHNLKFFFNMDLDTFDSMLTSQNGKCANIGCNNVNSATERLQVDHDHSCCNHSRRKTCGNCIRGLLCRKCNLILGQANDNVDYFLGLVRYLEKWKKSTEILTEKGFLSEEMPTTNELGEKKDGLGYDVLNTAPTDTKNYLDILLPVLPLDQTIFSLERTNI